MDQPKWNEAKLLKLIAEGIEEHLNLEYKAAGALARDSKAVNEIAKDVSAMANSDGGTIIYGIAEFRDKVRKHLPERIDPINRMDFSKEWLENIISHIRPRIPNVVIEPVPLGTGVDHVAYVVEVPQGATAHQANFYYYRRYNFESVPMMDHEIRDVMNRKTHPQIIIKPEFILYPRINENGNAGALRISIINDSDVLARYVAVVVDAPMKFRERFLQYENAVIFQNTEGMGLRLSFSNHVGTPLFPHGALKPLFKFQFCDRIQPKPQKPITEDFKYTVFADSMPKRQGTFSYNEILAKWPIMD